MGFFEVKYESGSHAALKSIAKPVEKENLMKGRPPSDRASED
jgi:hypothetical protein